MEQEHWSKRLQRLLRSRDWSYTELAKRSGVSRERIKKYVKGIVQKPRGRVIDRLAKALLVPTAWLKDGKPDLDPYAPRDGGKTLANNVASVLFPIRDLTKETMTPNKKYMENSQLESRRAAASKIIFGSSPEGDIFRQTMGPDPSRQYGKRGRPRKNPLPAQSDYYASGHFSQAGALSGVGGGSASASLQTMGLEDGGAETENGTPAEARATNPSSAPGSNKSVRAPECVSLHFGKLHPNPPASTPPSTAGAKHLYSVPVYDMSMLARPMDIGYVEPLCWQSFDERFLALPLKSFPNHLFAVIISDDAMHPTLRYGDRVIIDRSSQTIGPDGMYMLHWTGGMVIKRLCVNPATHSVHVISDNKEYTSYEGVQPNDIHVVGRLIWLSRSF